MGYAPDSWDRKVFISIIVVLIMALTYVGGRASNKSVVLEALQCAETNKREIEVVQEKHDMDINSVVEKLNIISEGQKIFIINLNDINKGMGRIEAYIERNN